MTVKSYLTQGTGRMLVVGFSKGDMLLETIQSEIDRLGIRYGVVVSAIGTLSTTVYHCITTLEDDPTNEFHTLNAPVELSAVQGMIVDGKPHLHMAFSDTERAYTGHLENGCEILYLGELVIMELADYPATRKPNPYNILLLDDNT